MNWQQLSAYSYAKRVKMHFAAITFNFLIKTRFPFHIWTMLHRYIYLVQRDVFLQSCIVSMSFPSDLSVLYHMQRSLSPLKLRKHIVSEITVFSESLEMLPVTGRNKVYAMNECTVQGSLACFSTFKNLLMLKVANCPLTYCKQIQKQTIVS